MTNSDLLSAQYDLTNDGIVFINTAQQVSKINKTASMLFNNNDTNSTGK